jgi:hypothetical protein
VIRLPRDKESRIKILSEHCAKIESLMQISVITNPVLIEYKDIEQLANERRICFLVEAPTFVMTYTDNGQVLTKNCIVETLRYDSNFSKMVQNRYQNGEVFVFYQLNKSMNTIRGAFMKSDIISKERDSRIDELLS